MRSTVNCGRTCTPANTSKSANQSNQSAQSAQSADNFQGGHAHQLKPANQPAILTLMENEAGAERVEAILRQAQALLPFPVLLEGYYISLQEQSEAAADRRYALMRNLPAVEIWAVDEPTLLTAACFKAGHRVPFAEALIAAFAAQHQAILVHKDPAFEALAGQVEQEPLPYK